MPELRWTLLILGVLFIAVLTWWERRRPRQASRSVPEPRSAPPSPESVGSRWDSAAEAVPMQSAGFREPTLTLPEIRSREPGISQDLPIVQISEESLTAMRAERTRSPVSALGSLPVLHPLPANVPKEPTDPDLVELPSVAAVATVLTDGPLASSEEEPAASDDEEVRAAGGLEPFDGSLGAEAVSEVHVREEPPLDLPPILIEEATSQPIVEWPPEDQRKVVALRLVSAPAERFPGRAVRQALAAEGFVMGKFEIFHKADESRRAVLSAASLTKPGTFDLDSMDSHRYGGLSLFAVLPGPKPPLEAFEELLSAARNLNERLQGALQDERGAPLTPMRVASLKESLEAETPS